MRLFVLPIFMFLTADAAYCWAPAQLQVPATRLVAGKRLCPDPKGISDFATAAKAMHAVDRFYTEKIGYSGNITHCGTTYFGVTFYLEHTPDGGVQAAYRLMGMGKVFPVCLAHIAGEGHDSELRMYFRTPMPSCDGNKMLPSNTYVTLKKMDDRGMIQITGGRGEQSTFQRPQYQQQAYRNYEPYDHVVQ